MQKFFYYGLGVLSVITGVLFMYCFLTQDYWENPVVIVTLGVECMVSTILFIMLEPRPRKTEAQRRHDDRIKNQGLGILTMITVAIAAIVLLASCSRNGYGCRGNHSWKKMEWKNTRP